MWLPGLLVLLLPGTFCNSDSSSTGHVDTILNSVEIIRKNEYFISINGITEVKETLPVFLYYYQAIALRQNLVTVRNYDDMNILPKEIKYTILKEASHLYTAIDNFVLKIDKSISLVWNHQFLKDTKAFYNLSEIEDTTIPKLYKKNIELITDKYIFPENYFEVIQGIKVTNLVTISLQLAKGRLNDLYYDARIKIANIFNARYTSLQKACSHDNATLGRTLHILFPARESKPIITSNLVESLGLKMGKDQSSCLFSFVVYLTLIENDLERILHQKLPNEQNHLSFIIPNIRDKVILMPIKTALPSYERRTKIFPSYPSIRLDKRNIFLSLIGAASENDRLHNSIQLKDVQAATLELKTVQTKLNGEYTKLLGSRIRENNVLTDIGEHVDNLEKSSWDLNIKMSNISQIATKSLQTLSGYMSISLALQIITEELNLIQEGFKTDALKLKKTLNLEGFDIFDSSLILTGNPLTPIQVKFNEQGISLSTKVGVDPLVWKGMIPRSLPITTSTGLNMITFDSLIITDGYFKINPQDLSLCDHSLRVCPPEASFKQLSPCEKYIINKNATQISLELVKDCVAKLQRIEKKELAYIHISKGILIYNPSSTIAYRICEKTTSTLSLPEGITRVILGLNCILKIHDYILKGSIYQYQNNHINYSFINAKMTDAVDALLHLHYNISSPEFNASLPDLFSIHGLSKHIRDYVSNITLTSNEIHYDETLWGMHPVEAVGNIGPTIAITILFILVLIMLITLCCCKTRIIRSCIRHTKNTERRSPAHSAVGYSTIDPIINITVPNSTYPRTTPVQSTSSSLPAITEEIPNNSEATGTTPPMLDASLLMSQVQRNLRLNELLLNNLNAGN